MPTRIGDDPENTLSRSLDEIAGFEADRVRAEDAAVTRVRVADESARAEAIATSRAAEVAEIAAQEAARERRRRVLAKGVVRAENRRQATVEAARVTALGEVRLRAEGAVRDHDLALAGVHDLAAARARTERGPRRALGVVSAALVLALCGGALGAWSATSEIARLRGEGAALSESLAAVTRGREHAAAADLEALDRRTALLDAYERELHRVHHEIDVPVPVAVPVPVPRARPVVQKHPAAEPDLRAPCSESGDPLCGTDGRRTD